MLLNNYSVRIPQGREHHQYVELKHDTKFTLVLANKNAEACDARVEIDGVCVGTWRLHAHQTIQLERGIDSEGRFTFYRSGSDEAAKAQLERVEDAKLGLVAVWFTPEKPRSAPTPQLSSWIFPSPTPAWVMPPQFSSGNATFASVNCSGVASDATVRPRSVCKSLSSGGTGLSGKSEQQFSTAPELELDTDRAVFIAVRLVCADTSQDIKPLVQRATPIPPPLG